MNDITRKIIHRIRVKFFPSKRDKTIQQWFCDDGDNSLRMEYNLDKSSLVIDVGGYKGQWASDIYARYNCWVYVFEPVSTFARKIQARFNRNEKILVFPLAIGKNNRQEIIYLRGDGTSMFGDSAEEETIEVVNVAEFFDGHHIEHCDLMKINIEGGEYELLPRLIETGLVKKIDNLQIQFHDITLDSEERMQEICNDLAKTHKPTYQYKFVWENWARMSKRG